MFGMKFSKLTMIALASVIAIPAIGATVSHKIRSHRTPTKMSAKTTLHHTVAKHTIVAHKPVITTSKSHTTAKKSTKIALPLSSKSKSKLVSHTAPKATRAKSSTSTRMASLPLMATRTKPIVEFGVRSMHGGHASASKN